MVLVAKDGEAYTSCTGSLNIKEVGSIVLQVFSISSSTGKATNKHFVGHELTVKQDNCPKDVTKEIWKSKKKTLK
jgi:hypothetical protein